MDCICFFVTTERSYLLFLRFLFFGFSLTSEASIAIGDFYQSSFGYSGWQTVGISAARLIFLWFPCFWLISHGRLIVAKLPDKELSDFLVYGVLRRGNLLNVSLFFFAASEARCLQQYPGEPAACFITSWCQTSLSGIFSIFYFFTLVVESVPLDIRKESYPFLKSELLSLILRFRTKIQLVLAVVVAFCSVYLFSVLTSDVGYQGTYRVVFYTGVVALLCCGSILSIEILAWYTSADSWGILKSLCVPVYGASESDENDIATQGHPENFTANKRFSISSTLSGEGAVGGFFISR